MREGTTYGRTLGMDGGHSIDNVEGDDLGWMDLEAQTTLEMPCTSIDFLGVLGPKDVVE